MRKIILLLAVMFCISCEDNFNFGDGTCIDCGSEIPLPPTKGGGNPPPPPLPPPQNRYDLGYNTGISDAVMLFNSTFTEVPCTLGPPAEDWEFDDEYEQYYSQIDNSTTRKCFVTTSSQKQAFNNFIIQYRANLQAKIDAGLDVNFNQGLLNGFNYKLLEYSVSYGINMP
jgi:hypothetical protein